MNAPLRWGRCLSLRGVEVEDFAASYLTQTHRHVLLVAGAGFDPRAARVTGMLAKYVGSALCGCFLRELRPSPSPELKQRADQNRSVLQGLVPNNEVVDVEVFASDGAIVGGRRVIGAIQKFELTNITDIVVDLSALSIGVGFPVVRYFLGRVYDGKLPINLHVMVTHAPTTDDAISTTASDRADLIAGFRAGFGIDERSRSAKLWLPHLVRGKRTILERIHSYVSPHDICPVLPFPSREWRLGDSLLEEYQEELAGSWEVDSRNIVYAAEDNPLDLYRTILRIADARTRVFAGIGGSLVVLSPIGSKLLSIGALMAALERDFPVAYVEAIGYTVDWEKMDAPLRSQGEIVHLWLHGQAYTSAAQNGVPV